MYNVNFDFASVQSSEESCIVTHCLRIQVLYCKLKEVSFVAQRKLAGLLTSTRNKQAHFIYLSLIRQHLIAVEFNDPEIMLLKFVFPRLSNQWKI